MSETQTPAPAEEYVPRDVLSAEDNEDATKPLQPPPEQPQGAPQEAAETKLEPDPEEERKKTERRREAQRIAWLTKQRYAEQARANAAEARLRELQGHDGTQRQPTREEFEQLIDQRAAEKLAAQQRDERFRAWDEQGQEQFGREKFLEACRTVSDFASGSDAQRAALVDVALDTEGGQKAIMELAENPEEAERILALPPHRMALAIAKLAAPPPAPPPRAVSNAPPPIRPPTVGRARGQPDPEHGGMDAFERWSAQQNWRR